MLPWTFDDSSLNHLKTQRWAIPKCSSSPEIYWRLQSSLSWPSCTLVSWHPASQLLRSFCCLFVVLDLVFSSCWATVFISNKVGYCFAQLPSFQWQNSRYDLALWRVIENFLWYFPLQTLTSHHARTHARTSFAWFDLVMNLTPSLFCFKTSARTSNQMAVRPLFQEEQPFTSGKFGAGSFLVCTTRQTKLSLHETVYRCFVTCLGKMFRDKSRWK